jgi:hypothetical protein
MDVATRLRAKNSRVGEVFTRTVKTIPSSIPRAGIWSRSICGGLTHQR